MAKGKRKRIDPEEELAKPWCYYCERVFVGLNDLTSHMKQMHLQCTMCRRKLNSAGGLRVHLEQVHKESLTIIEHALPNRSVPPPQGPEIFAMVGIPEDVVAAHRQRIIDEIAAQDPQAFESTNIRSKGKEGANKKPKVEVKETLAEVKARAKAMREKKQARRAAIARGEPVSDEEKPTKTKEEATAGMKEPAPPVVENAAPEQSEPGNVLSHDVLPSGAQAGRSLHVSFMGQQHKPSEAGLSSAYPKYVSQSMFQPSHYSLQSPKPFETGPPGAYMAPGAPFGQGPAPPPQVYTLPPPSQQAYQGPPGYLYYPTQSSPQPPGAQRMPGMSVPPPPSLGMFGPPPASSSAALPYRPTANVQHHQPGGVLGASATAPPTVDPRLAARQRSTQGQASSVQPPVHESNGSRPNSRHFDPSNLPIRTKPSPKPSLPTLSAAPALGSPHATEVSTTAAPVISAATVGDSELMTDKKSSTKDKDKETARITKLVYSADITPEERRAAIARYAFRDRV